MLIKIHDRSLYILRTLEKTDTAVVYICTDLFESEPKQYFLNGLLKKEYYQIQIPIVLDMQKNIRFTDFVDCFSADGIFYLMFKYTEGKPILDSVNQPREKRLENIRQLIEQITLQDMPFCFQQAVIDPEKIVISKEYGVRFRYCLSTLETDADMHKIELCLLELIKKLLYNELKMRYSDELSNFYKKLQNGGSFENYTELYAAFSLTYEELSEKKENLVSKRLRFQVWELCKKYWKKVKKALFFATVTAVVAVCIFKMTNSLKPKSENGSFEQIGMLKIRENQPVTEAGE